MNEKATIDFESRSACNLKKCGAWKYSLDPTTEILCLAFRLPYWETGRTGLWYPGQTKNEDFCELRDWIEAGELVEAHNAWFERSLWTNVLARYAFCPAISPRQWRCSAAKAAAHGLPRGLDDALTALQLDIRKDPAGVKVMMKMSKPRETTPGDTCKRWLKKYGYQTHLDTILALETEFEAEGSSERRNWWEVCAGTASGKARRVHDREFQPIAACQKRAGLPVTPNALYGPFYRDESFEAVETGALEWHDTPKLREQLYAYCRQDVLAEEALSAALPDLSDAETTIYLLDQSINERGFQIDGGAVAAALRLIHCETVRLNTELERLTCGKVTKATQRAQLLAWLAAEEGVHLPDTTKETVEHVLRDATLSLRATQVLTILRQLGRSSTAKYEAMRNWMDSDGRVRGGLIYHGASTGRWSGAGVQPHNFPRGEKQFKDQDALWADLKAR